MTPIRVPILVVTGRHSLSCSLAHGDQRILEVLNDRSSEFLQIKDVEVHRCLCIECTEKLDEATIRKSAIDFVLLRQDKHEAAHRRPFAFVDKHPYRANLLLGEHEIEGILMLKGATDPVVALGREASSFIPITNAQLSSYGAADPPKGV